MRLHRLLAFPRNPRFHPAQVPRGRLNSQHGLLLDPPQRARRKKPGRYWGAIGREHLLGIFEQETSGFDFAALQVHRDGRYAKLDGANHGESPAMRPTALRARDADACP